ncbi:hypothetical protein BofuT4_uP008740.1 [Botrytis cinerea T4]|uniref:Uncharacterized protein n=1 Tax=Botryotinia fuckeliana (strain T4) TaxID=999810 RepID=G2XX79_BOTF4|nr:hypothetical protein BofuT4_uP008740.1 [Botrytis cinerea T4]
MDNIPAPDKMSHGTRKRWARGVISKYFRCPHQVFPYQLPYPYMVPEEVESFDFSG